MVSSVTLAAGGALVSAFSTVAVAHALLEVVDAGPQVAALTGERRPQLEEEARGDHAVLGQQIADLARARRGAGCPPSPGRGASRGRAGTTRPETRSRPRPVPAPPPPRRARTRSARSCPRACGVTGLGLRLGSCFACATGPTLSRWLTRRVPEGSSCSPVSRSASWSCAPVSSQRRARRSRSQRRARRRSDRCRGRASGRAPAVERRRPPPLVPPRQARSQAAQSGPARTGAARVHCARTVPPRTGPHRAGPRRAGPRRAGPYRAGPRRARRDRRRHCWPARSAAAGPRVGRGAARLEAGRLALLLRALRHGRSGPADGWPATPPGDERRRASPRWHARPTAGPGGS